MIILGFFCTVSYADDTLFYKLNPRKLEKAIASCQDVQSSRCIKLKEIALRINDLAYELRLDPQAFGQKILLLQETIANPESSTVLVQTKDELQERLAVVKWLESPES